MRLALNYVCLRPRMKEYMCTWYQRFIYKEGFGPDKVPHSQKKISELILARLSMRLIVQRGSNSLVRMGTRGTFFISVTYILPITWIREASHAFQGSGSYDWHIGSNGGDLCFCDYFCSGGPHTNYNYCPNNNCDYYLGYKSLDGPADNYNDWPLYLRAFIISFSYQEESDD